MVCENSGRGQNGRRANCDSLGNWTLQLFCFSPVSRCAVTVWRVSFLLQQYQSSSFFFLTVSTLLLEVQLQMDQRLTEAVFCLLSS